MIIKKEYESANVGDSLALATVSLLYLIHQVIIILVKYEINISSNNYMFCWSIPPKFIKVYRV